MTDQNTNLPLVDERSTSTIRTLSLFNGYFEQEVKINTSVYDIVNGFFLNRMKSPEAANALAAAVLTTTYNNKIDPLTFIKELEEMSSIQLTDVLALYLNETRRNTSLLGVTVAITPNIPVARNILA